MIAFGGSDCLRSMLLTPEMIAKGASMVSPCALDLPAASNEPATLDEGSLNFVTSPIDCSEEYFATAIVYLFFKTL
jgi:hypothetical protein